MTVEHSAALVAHPDARAEAVQGLKGRVSIATPGALRFEYSLEADLSRLRVPPPGPGRRLDELWRHTCFEAFVAHLGETAYHEFNFSPSRDWAAYRFSGYREGMTPAQLDGAPRIDVHQEGGRLQLDCVVAWPVTPTAARLRVALAAVIEADDGRVSYWAVRHAPGRPDFHHPAAFALEIVS